MDSDGQDDPAEIPALLEKLDEGFDLVSGWKRDREDPAVRVLASRLYNRAVGFVFGLRLRDVNCGFKVMRSDVAKSLQLKRDYHRLIPVMAVRAGYAVAEAPVAHRPRRYGQSKYGPGRYLAALRDVASLAMTRTPRG
jgi:dolichol-phosphate mannosyltransferase